MKNLKRVLSLLLCLIMVVGLVPTTALAADSDTEISTVVATLANTLNPALGAEVTKPQITVTTGNPAYFSSSMNVWQKKNSDTWENFYASTFIAGTYRYSAQLRIDDSEGGEGYVLATEGLTVTVDGTPWTIGNVKYYGNYSLAAVFSPEFNVTTDSAPTTYTVTFDSNGGSAVTAQTVESGKTATKPTDPTKSGYTFQGWYLGENEYDFTSPVTGAIELKAKWEPVALLTKAPENITLAPGESKGVSMIFTYRVLGGTDWGNADINGDSYGFDRLINFGAQAGVEVTPYTFTYDATKAGTTETYWLTYTCTDANNQNFPGEKVSFTVTYLEAAAPTTYTVTFNANGGSVTPVSGTTGTDGKLTVLPIPTHTNSTKEFDGWYDAATGGNKVELDKVYTANTTIYARWKDKPPVEPTTATIVVKKVDEAGQPLAGAQFRMYISGLEVQFLSKVTGADGIATFTGVTDGDYMIEETVAPDGYQKSGEAKALKIENGVAYTTGEGQTGSEAYDNNEPFVFVNEQYKATFYVTKTDGTKSLAGAAFKLENTVAGRTGYTATSGTDGKVTFADVVDGEYILSETQAPEGYTKSESLVYFKVENGEVKYSSDRNSYVAYYNTLSIVNEKTAAEPETVDISGTKTWVGDEETDRPESIIVNLVADGETVSEVEVTAETQWTFRFSEQPKYDESGAEIKYTVEEEPVEGYTATYDGFDITNTKDEEPEPETATIVVKKTDEDGKALAGAKFTLSKTDKTYTATSGANGLVTFEVVEAGYYTLVETEAPDGYVKTTETWSFTVLEDGTVKGFSSSLEEQDFRRQLRSGLCSQDRRFLRHPAVDRSWSDERNGSGRR